MPNDISDATILAEFYCRRSFQSSEFKTISLPTDKELFVHIKSAFNALDVSDQIDFVNAYIFDLPPGIIGDMIEIVRSDQRIRDSAFQEKLTEIENLYDQWFGEPRAEDHDRIKKVNDSDE